MGNVKYGNDLFPLKEMFLVLHEPLANGFHITYHSHCLGNTVRRWVLKVYDTVGKT